jgi:general secretion pathway protein K
MRHFPVMQRGVALILVLWVAILLTVIAGSFAFAMRTDMQVVQNSVAIARAEAAANAGVHRALLELFKPPTDAERWQADGQAHEITLAGAKVTVSVLDESGKIDINAAAIELLKGLFLSAGLKDEEAVALVDAVQDWRDADDLRRLNGAEEPEYRAAGLKYKPANAPFQTIEELQLVLGMKPEIYHRIAGFITVYARQPGLNAAIASRAALLAIPGATAEQVDGYMAQREAARAAKQPVPLFPPAARFAGVSYNLAYSLRAEARLEDGTVFVREAVAQILPDPRRPFTFLAWKESVPVSSQSMNDKSTTDNVQPR